MLPVGELTLPILGTAPLNLATALVKADNPTDLGPKTYIAYGRCGAGKGGGRELGRGPKGSEKGPRCDPCGGRRECSGTFLS
jgi:hypothetical protein